MTRELLEITRTGTVPLMSRILLKVNFEGMGERDKEEFERDFNEILDLAETAMEMKQKYLNFLNSQIRATSMLFLKEDELGVLSEKIITADVVTLLGIILAGVALGLIGYSDTVEFRRVCEYIGDEALQLVADREGEQ